jgi:septal ring factor EnvC (AmiA/AmiB activator)
MRGLRVGSIPGFVRSIPGRLWRVRLALFVFAVVSVLTWQVATTRAENRAQARRLRDASQKLDATRAELASLNTREQSDVRTAASQLATATRVLGSRLSYVESSVGIIGSQSFRVPNHTHSVSCSDYGGSYLICSTGPPR